MNHVALVGLMGSGKTSVGRRLAKLLDRPFVDCDEGFVARFGRTVADVFAADGEEVFRDMESTLLGELLDVREPLVLATGGGAVIRDRNRARLAKDDVTVVLLDASPEFLATRARTEAHRPLLAGDDPAEVLRRLHQERIERYREVADHVVEVEPFHEAGEPKSSMAEHIAGLLR